MPDNLHPKDAENPYADYTVEQMYAFVKGWTPARPPGVQFEYSNLGMGLLGHALALHAGKAYDVLLAERVLLPLGMRDTRLAVGREDAKPHTNFARGHDADGNPVRNWDFPTLAAVGAVRSTANDMLKFVAGQIDEASPLAEAAKLARTPLRAAPPGNQIGLGWHIRDGKDHIVWHNGMTGGYHAYCGYVAEKKIGVVVLGNNVTGTVDAVGMRLLDRMLGRKLEPIPLPQIKALSAAALDACAGRYVLFTGMQLTVSRDGDRMFCQASGQARARIYPESDTSFFYKVVNAKLSFKLDKTGRAYAVTLEQDGVTVPGMRATSEPTTMTTTRPAK
jgi:CubicO group peptidase (beta-lactamase class C family)